MIYRLQRSIRIKTTLEEAWQFFSNPLNLKLMTPPSLAMRIVSPIEAEIHPGMILVYKVHPILSIPLTWVSEITHVEKLRMFVDEQRYGPYRMWHHQHLFKEIRGGVIAEDIVDYILPYGPVGVVAHRLFVAKQLRAIFDFRAAFLSRQFGVIEDENNAL